MEHRWNRDGSELIYDAGILRLRKDAYTLDGRPSHPFYVLEAPPWINVVAVTEAGDLLLVRQYRHGTCEVTLEVPGGAVDSRDGDPAAAAARELLEETGYGGVPLQLLGEVTCNPAILDNRTYCYLAEGVRRLAEPALDPWEALELELRPARDVPTLLREGAIHHALSVSALSLYLLARQA